MYKTIVPVIISSCLVGCGGGSSTGKEDNNTSVSKPTVPNKPTTLNNNHILDGLWVFRNNKFAIYTSDPNDSTLKVVDVKNKSQFLFDAKVSELGARFELVQRDRYGNFAKKDTYRPIDDYKYVNINDVNDFIIISNDDGVDVNKLKLFNYLNVNNGNYMALTHKNYSLDFMDNGDTYCKIHIDISHMKNNLFQITGSAENCNDVKNNGQVSGFAGFWSGEDGEPHLPGYITLNNNKSLSLYGSKSL